MRLLVHDYGGYAFPVQLSRALAHQGHTVHHVYYAENSTALGPLAPQPDDPPGFSVEGLRLARPVDKRARSLAGLVARRRAEAAYGALAAQAVTRFRPDVVLSANTPLDAQRQVLEATHAAGAAFVFWVQDLIAVAARRILRRRLGLLGDLVGRVYERLERRLLRQSDHIVLITDDFRPLLKQWQVETPSTTIENWAPLGRLPLHPKDTPWSRAHGLDAVRVVLYAGTLGMKHNPALLSALAARLPEDARLVVLSEGPGADWLAQAKREQRLDRLVLLPFQPFDALPEVLASADVLAAVLEPDASVFSVPSKVLTYLCAGRALLLAVPPENLAARIVQREEAGRVVSPEDVEAFVAECLALLGAPEARQVAGRKARAYAERAFDLSTIAARFDALFRSL